MSRNRCVLLIAVLILIGAACRAGAAIPTPTPEPYQTAVALAVTQTLRAQPTPTRPPATPTPSPTSTATLLPSPTPVAFYEPAGCQKPPDGLDRLEVNQWTLNRRTLAMLERAQWIYGGPEDLAGKAITQGSYHDNGAASFGTHLGGGAVDLSIFLPGTWTVDFARLERLVRSLRAAGFAAWVRLPDEVFPGSGYHIHAIAVGDPELSKEAAAQLTGASGYFYGFNGLPAQNGVPVADHDGGPVVCGWMKEMGYADLRAGAPDLQGLPVDWQDRLAKTAAGLVTVSGQDTAALAARLASPVETLDGPLARALWSGAGLLPPAPNPAAAAPAFRPAAGRLMALAAWLPSEDYELASYPLPPGQFDFTQRPLLPGDMVELRAAGRLPFLFVVTEADSAGRVYTTAPQRQPDRSWRVERLLLYDPGDSTAGLLKGEWSDASPGGAAWDSFTLLRYRWTRLPAGVPFQYAVQPGDTLPEIAARFGASVDALIRANNLSDPAQLDVDQVLVIPN